MATKISVTGLTRPAPRWWRQLERGLLTTLIPAAVAIIQGMEFKNELMAIRVTLWVNVGLVAIIKFIGMMMVDTEDNYVSNLPEKEQEKIEDVNVPPVEKKP